MTGTRPPPQARSGQATLLADTTVPGAWWVVLDPLNAYRHGLPRHAGQRLGAITRTQHGWVATARPARADQRRHRAAAVPLPAAASPQGALDTLIDFWRAVEAAPGTAWPPSAVAAPAGSRIASFAETGRGRQQKRGCDVTRAAQIIAAIHLLTG